MASVIHLQVSTPRQAARRRVRLDRLLNPEMLKALAEPTRARLLSCLLKCARPCSVTEVADCCAIDFSMVARHLATMARAGLLSSQKKGRTVWYAADGPALAQHFRQLADAIDELRPVRGCCTTGACACASTRDTPADAAQSRAPVRN
ncbi:MAG: metalloregulator ArsR/SmtB family transcription factor [Planctomycetota bacterium]|nr:metalloregulator ArsR/SmtB family transcription factor [Planctomycetota bacterium]